MDFPGLPGCAVQDGYDADFQFGECCQNFALLGACYMNSRPEQPPGQL